MDTYNEHQKEIIINKVFSINHIPNFSILCLAIDRNIFNDAWNGVKDAWNTGVSGARFAGLLANCNGDLRSIVSDFDATFIDDFKLMKDKREVHPHFGHALEHFGQELGKMAKNLDDLSTCMKGSWFGRTYENTRSLKVAATSPGI